MSELKYRVVVREDNSCDVFYTNGSRVSLLEDKAFFRTWTKWDQFEIPAFEQDRFVKMFTCPNAELQEFLQSTNETESLLARKRLEWFGEINPVSNEQEDAD